MEIYLAKTQGFCSGVTYAVTIVDKALEKYGTPLFVYHEIVHNTYVVNDFKKRGVVFVEDIEEVPDGSRIIFSAHGVAPSTIEKCKNKDLKIIDATCPLVNKVHNEAVNFSNQNFEVILIGHKGHQEVIGTAGYVDPELLHIVENEDDVDALDIDTNKDVAYITQTTLSIDETKKTIDRLKQRFPNLDFPARSDVCYATQIRQDAVKELAKLCDVIIICGSANSSNSNRLRETGQNQGVESYIVDNSQELDTEILKGKNNVGISSGASVPRIILDGIIEKIKSEFDVKEVHTFEDPEKDIVFHLPEL